MRRLALVAALFVITACVHPIDTATITVNDARAILEVAGSAITRTCVPAYNSAQTTADLATVDGVCLPARDAYAAGGGAWLLAAAAVLVARVDGDLRPLLPLLPRLASALVVLSTTVAKLGVLPVGQP